VKREESSAHEDSSVECKCKWDENARERRCASRSTPGCTGLGEDGASSKELCVSCVSTEADRVRGQLGSTCGGESTTSGVWWCSS
jgi:hypothetical protein